MEKRTMTTAASPLEQRAESLAKGDSLYEVVNGQRNPK
jgi:hypothetical protein